MQRWHVVAPPGWTAVPHADDLPALRAQREAATRAGISDVHTWVWAPGGGGSAGLLVLEERGPQTQDLPHDLAQVIAGYTDGARDAKVLREPYGATIDTVRESRGVRQWQEMVCGVAPDKHVEMSVVSCTGDEAVCRAAIASFSYDRTGFLPIDWSHETSAARTDGFYQAGRVLGPIVLALLAWFVWSIVRRKRGRAIATRGGRARS